MELSGCRFERHKNDQQLIRQVLDTITSGQELDLRRFAGASKENIVALATEQDFTAEKIITD